MQTVRNDVRELRLVNIGKLVEFQGNLKDLSSENYEKLKNDILSLGFSEAFTAWDDAGVLKLLNGHQRLRTLTKMAESGILVPELPVQVVTAKDAKEAALKVLSLTSQFGQITSQGLYEFMGMNNLSLVDDIMPNFNFNEINFANFAAEFSFDVIPTDLAFGNLKEGDREGFCQITFTLTDEQLDTVNKALEAARDKYQDPTNENKNGNSLYYIMTKFVNEC